MASDEVLKELALLRIQSIFRISAWRAFFFGGMHACFLTIFYILLVNEMKASSYDLLWKILGLIASLGIYMVSGFLVNDYFDMAVDKIAGKAREIHHMPKGQVVGMILLIILLGHVVTFLTFLSIGQPLYALIYVIGYFLGIFYSAPPLRFKERGILGIMINALIEKALPVLLVVFFLQHFYLDALFLLVLVSVWEIELILIHQYADYEEDLKAQVKTYVIEIGLEKTMRVLDRLQSLVALLFVVFCVVILIQVPYSVVFFIFVIIGYFLLNRLRRSSLLAADPRSLGPSRFYADENKVRDLRRSLSSFLGACFEGPFPLFAGVILTLRFAPYIILLLLSIASQYYLIRGHYQGLLRGGLSLFKKISLLN